MRLFVQQATNVSLLRQTLKYHRSNMKLRVRYPSTGFVTLKILFTENIVWFIAVEITYGACVPEAACDMDLCSQMPSTISGLKTNLTYNECNAFCCDNNLCNDDVATSMTTTASDTITKEITTGD